MNDKNKKSEQCDWCHNHSMFAQNLLPLTWNDDADAWLCSMCESGLGDDASHRWRQVNARKMAATK